MLARMVRPTLAALSALPFVLLACGEKAPPPVTPVTVESAEPVTSGRPPIAKADAALAKAGIGPGTVRLSIGLEHPDDLLEDLARALRASQK